MKVFIIVSLYGVVLSGRLYHPEGCDEDTCPPYRKKCPFACNMGDEDNMFHDCVAAMHVMMRVSIVRDCEAAFYSSGVMGKEYLAFVENIKAVCQIKKIPLNTPHCCDDCDFSGQKCYEAMDGSTQEATTKRCYNSLTLGTAHPFYWFRLETDTLCHDKCLPPLTFCRCSSAASGICDFSDPDHPTHACYMAWPAFPTFQRCYNCDLHGDCDNVWIWIGKWCDYIGVTWSRPPCPGCHPCHMDGLPLYENLSRMMKKPVYHDCCHALQSDDIKAYENFLLNLKGVATLKKQKPMCPCMCDFENEDCFKHLDPMIQAAIVSDCKSTGGDPTSQAYWDLLDNLKVVCQHKCYNPMYPCPGDFRP